MKSACDDMNLEGHVPWVCVNRYTWNGKCNDAVLGGACRHSTLARSDDVPEGGESEMVTLNPVTERASAQDARASRVAALQAGENSSV